MAQGIISDQVPVQNRRPAKRRVASAPIAQPITPSPTPSPDPRKLERIVGMILLVYYSAHLAVLLILIELITQGCSLSGAKSGEACT